MFDNAKRTFEVPEGVAPSKFLENTQHVSEPAQGDIIRGVFETAKFPNVNLCAASFHLPPGLVATPERGAIPPLTLPYQPRIFRPRGMDMTGPPGCLMV